VRHYINKHEMNPTLYDFLRSRVDSRPATPLRNKLKFAAMCAEEGLPAIPVLALFSEAGPRWVERSDSVGDGELPAVDLFVKPVNASSGRGAERWDAIGPSRYRRNDGKTLTGAELIEHVRKRCGSERRFIVQPRVENHAELADLNNGALATVRVVTCRNEAGEIECTHAILRMAVEDGAVVDNFHGGGVAANVDLATGELGRASDVGVRADRGWCENHPSTGAQIYGRKLSHWQEIIDLAVRAHRVFGDRTLVGWDVALLPDGPVLVEAQGRSDLDIVQRICHQGLGASRCGELIAHHIEHAERSRSGDPALG